MYPEYRVIQIIEIPPNGDTTPYAVRYYAQIEYFDFDFMSKSTLKEYLKNHRVQSGEYIIIHDNENSGARYIVDAICSYEVKENGTYLNIKHPGEKWQQLVNKVLDNPEIVDTKPTIQTMNKLKIPKIGV
nr:MAG TPA: hypothetical protein [Caudoviricetes sp.]